MSRLSRPLLNALFVVSLATLVVTPAAVLAVPVPPTITMAFGASAIAHGTSTSLTFTITNPNSDSFLTWISFDDALPGGLAVADPNALASSCPGGIISAAPASSAFHFMGGALLEDSSCTVSIDVVGAAQGVWTNTTGVITSNQTAPGGTATATLKVGIPPTVSMSFNPSSILPNETSTLTFGLYNPEWSNTDLTGITFTDRCLRGSALPTPPPRSARTRPR